MTSTNRKRCLAVDHRVAAAINQTVTTKASRTLSFARANCQANSARPNRLGFRFLLHLFYFCITTKTLPSSGILALSVTKETSSSEFLVVIYFAVWGYWLCWLDQSSSHLKSLPKNFRRFLAKYEIPLWIASSLRFGKFWWEIYGYRRARKRGI